MTWLLWRQHRLQAAWSGGALALLAIILWWTGVRMADTYRAALACRTSSTCGSVALFQGYGALTTLVNLTIAVPLLLGVFWGGPLIGREIETGTHTLAWTQSVSRRHWLYSKLILLVLATMVWSTGLTAIVTWWSGTLNSVRGNRFDPGIFEVQGVVPVAYSLFAVALGVAAGAVFRRTLPALAVTVFGYAAVRIVVDNYVRSHYRAPVVSAARLDQASPASSGSWTISNDLTLNGHPVSGPLNVNFQCGGVGTRQAMDKCLGDLGYQLTTKYQPANRYWPFQFIESALFVALALVLIAVCVIAVRRRDA
ncbi:MAG TPA: hypothetical protein VGH11_15920 [Jatrophihabitans sp.]|jgi:hypothetical protein